MSHDVEKLGARYLGGEQDAASGKRRGMLLLGARDLTTHGVTISEHDPVWVRRRRARQVEWGDPGTRVSVVAGEGRRV